MRIVLASASPRRRELLARLGKPFDVIPAGTEEFVNPGTTPAQAIQQIARQKATAVAAFDRSETVVIGADTAVILGSEVLGKPSDREAACEMLWQLRGQTHQLSPPWPSSKTPPATVQFRMSQPPSRCTPAPIERWKSMSPRESPTTRPEPTRFRDSAESLWSRSRAAT